MWNPHEVHNFFSITKDVLIFVSFTCERYVSNQWFNSIESIGLKFKKKIQNLMKIQKIWYNFKFI